MGRGGSPKRQYYAAFAEQMGDEEVMVEEEVVGAGGEGVVLKKRRLSSEQVRYLESSFESENKLEPERKAQIAQKLGLQPRQVAVWFQNRRARSKSKQLERDYNALKADYDAIVLENEKLRAQVDRLTAQLREGSVPTEGGHTAAATEMKAVKTSASNVCSSNCGSVGVKVEAEASTASEGVGQGKRELGDGEEQCSPCMILADLNVNVNLSASMMPLTPAATAAAAAAVRAKVADTSNYEALEEIQLLYAHQLGALACVDSLYSGDSFHYDLIALQDDYTPWFTNTNN